MDDSPAKQREERRQLVKGRQRRIDLVLFRKLMAQSVHGFKFPIELFILYDIVMQHM